MAKVTLIKTRFAEGVWSGVFENYTLPGPPDVVIGNHDRTLSDVKLEKEASTGLWHVQVTVPSNAICDQGEVFVITDRQTGKKLGSFAVFTDATAGLNLKTEVDLLRAELDMLKRAFRRHCTETEI